MSLPHNNQIDVNSLSHQWFSVLKSKSVDLQQIQDLLSKGANPNESFNKDEYPLLLACSNYRGTSESLIDILKHLINAGADPQKTNEEGITFFHKLCIQKDAPAIIAVLNEPDPSIFKVDVKQVTANRFNPIHLLMIGGFPILSGAAKEEDLEKVVDLLLQKGANVNPEKGFDARAASPLELAIKFAKGIAIKLIEAGADVNQPNQNGDSLLCDALKPGEKDHYELLRLLISRGLDVPAAIKDRKGGFNPLELALIHSNTEALELMFGQLELPLIKETLDGWKDNLLASIMSPKANTNARAIEMKKYLEGYILAVDEKVALSEEVAAESVKSASITPPAQQKSTL